MAQEENGLTPLHMAALTGTVDSVELLLEWDADVSVRGWGEETPLHFAVLKNTPAVVQKLLDWELIRSIWELI